MKSFIPADQSTRDIIVSNLDETFAVSAGAGTGKTTLLTQRYISILKQKKISPTEIVAITFTKKAASELRERIYSEMIRQNMRDALMEIELSPIGTIHSFCATVLKRFAIESGLDPHFKQLEGIEQYEFLRQNFRIWISKNVGDSKIFQELKSTGMSFSQIQQVALQLYHYRDLIHTIKIDFTATTHDQIQNFLSMTQSILKFGQLHCVDMTDEGYEAILRLYRSIENIGSLPIDQAARIILREDGISKKGRQTSWKNKDLSKEFKTKVDELRTELESIQRNYSSYLLKELVNWLEGFLSYIEDEKRRQSVLDFDDLLLLTRNLIRSNAEVRKALQDQFKYFLIDEFQDTDPIQTEIFWMLSKKNNGKHSYDDDLIPGKIFTVGDASQSIYRFRNASVETYRRCVSSIERQGKLLLIHQNFRSNPHILHSLNPFFTGMLQNDFHELSTLPEETWNQPAIHVLKNKSDDALKAEIRSHEAYSIASHIRYLIDSETEIFDRKQERTRKLTYADISILFPVSTSMEIYELAFKSAGIPFSLYKSSSFFQTLEVRSVLRILHAISKPFDELEVASALSSFLMGYSFDDLVIIKKTFGTFDFREMNTSKLSPNLSHQIQTLQHLHSEISNLTPSKLMDLIFSRTSAIDLAQLRFDRDQVVQNFEKLKWLAQSFESDHNSNVFEFIDWIQQTSDHSDEITEARLPTESNAVQLMTIHQSKGLEFSVVFVANLTSKFTSNVTWIANRYDESLEFRIGDMHSFFKTKNFDSSLESEKNFLSDEKKRLMYVALTRAKNILVIPAPSEGDEKTFMEFVAPLFDQGNNFEAFNYGNEWKKVSTLTSKSIQKTLPLDFGYLKNIPAGLKRVTATEEKEEAITVSKKPYPFLTRPKLGIAFHTYIERHPLSQTKVDEEILNQISTEALIDANKLKNIVEIFLQSDLFKRVQNSNRVLREVPFSFFDNDLLFEGFIDLMFEENGNWNIVDLKTDKISERELNDRAAIYKNQLDIYVTALKKLNLTVNQKILYFVRINQEVVVP